MTEELNYIGVSGNYSTEDDPGAWPANDPNANTGGNSGSIWGSLIGSLPDLVGAFGNLIGSSQQAPTPVTPVQPAQSNNSSSNMVTTIGLIFVGIVIIMIILFAMKKIF